VIVYVESNFVLEIALEQEQAVAAREILSLAEQGKIKLIFPSFVLSEPFECIMRGRRDHNSLLDSLNKILKELRRSEPHKDILLNANPILNILREAHTRQLDLLYKTFKRLLYIGTCADIDVAAFEAALNYQTSLGLSPQDSIVYATIIGNLKTQPGEEWKCFLSRDSKAFNNDDDRSIKGELAGYSCRYIGSFAQGLDFIQHTLKQAG
jgi:predicted nucleic acid-binding protein